MTPGQHKRQAEEILEAIAIAKPLRRDEAIVNILRAQVHATLATVKESA